MHPHAEHNQRQFALLVLYRGSARQGFCVCGVGLGRGSRRAKLLRNCNEIAIFTKTLGASTRRIRGANAREYPRIPREYPPKMTANTPRIPTRAGHSFSQQQMTAGAIGCLGYPPRAMHHHGGGAVRHARAVMRMARAASAARLSCCCGCPGLSAATKWTPVVFLCLSWAALGHSWASGPRPTCMCV